MNRSSFLSCIICLTIVVSCTTQSGSNSETATDVGGVLVSYESLTFKDENCTSEPCTYYSVSLPRMRENKALEQKIIEQAYKTFWQEDKDAPIPPIETIAAEFISDYQKAAEEWGDMGPWYVIVDIEILLYHPEHITIKVSSDQYSGGAHPNAYVSILNLYKDGSVKLTEDWVADLPLLARIVEKQFRRQFGVSDDETYADRGFQFPDDQFVLADNMGLTASHLIVFYNNYEIASYAQGQFELKVPISEIKNYLKIQL